MKNITTVRRHVTTNATTQVADHSVYIAAMYISCSNDGTTWTVSVRDRSTPPMALVPVHNLSPSSDGLAWVIDFKDKPAYMKDGVDIITAGGTPGILDFWIFLNDQPS